MLMKYFSYKFCVIVILLISSFFAFNLFAQCENCPYHENCTVVAKTNISKDKLKDINNSKHLRLNAARNVKKDKEISKERKKVAATVDVKRRMKFPIYALIFTVLAGIFVRNKILRNYRKVFLFFTLIFFGFHGYYAGPCLCPVGNFQQLVIFDGNIINYFVSIASLLILLPITYFFGKVWCGWVCHLGGLQEFLYANNKIKVLKSEEAQKVMKIMRIILVAVIIIHAAFHQARTFCHIDPFKAIFTLSFVDRPLMIVLCILTIVLSLLIYRPFCRAVCPIGLMLGLVSKIPHAHKIIYSTDETKHISNCKACVNACGMQAISNLENSNNKKINDFDCIACGNCLSKCPANGIGLKTNKKTDD